MYRLLRAQLVLMMALAMASSRLVAEEPNVMDALAAAHAINSEARETRNETPAMQALKGLAEMGRAIGLHQRSGENGLQNFSSEKALCFASTGRPPSTPGFLCLNGRFLVAGSWQNPFNGTSGYAGAVQLTPASGVLFFSDATNFEVVVKELNGCFSSPSGHWIFTSGLTNFGARVAVEDELYGSIELYENLAGQNFNLIIDQFTSFPCP